MFWPFTDTYNIWYCEGPGDISLKNDFDNIAPDEKERINGYLNAKRNLKTTPAQLLVRHEKIYALRNQKENWQ